MRKTTFDLLVDSAWSQLTLSEIIELDLSNFRGRDELGMSMLEAADLSTENMPFMTLALIVDELGDTKAINEDALITLHEALRRDVAQSLTTALIARAKAYNELHSDSTYVSKMEEYERRACRGCGAVIVRGEEHARWCENAPEA